MAKTQLKKRKDGRYCRRITLPSGDKVDLYGQTQKEVNDQVDEVKLRYAMGAVAIKNKIMGHLKVIDVRPLHCQQLLNSMSINQRACSARSR